MSAIKEVFGNGITGMNTVTSRDPHSFKDLLLSPDSSVRSCFIVMESTNMKEELLTKSNSAVYQDLLKTASWTVGKNIFFAVLSPHVSVVLMHLQFIFWSRLKFLGHACKWPTAGRKHGFVCYLNFLFQLFALFHSLSSINTAIKTIVGHIRFVFNARSDNQQGKN